MPPMFSSKVVIFKSILPSFEHVDEAADELERERNRELTEVYAVGDPAESPWKVDAWLGARPRERLEVDFKLSDLMTRA
jgi:hypothetical protein